jgi:hypothetical protein
MGLVILDESSWQSKNYHLKSVMSNLKSKKDFAFLCACLHAQAGSLCVFAWGRSAIRNPKSPTFAP